MARLRALEHCPARAGKQEMLPPARRNESGVRLIAGRAYRKSTAYPRGSPRPRVAMIPRWISLVPAATVPETAWR